MVCLTVERVHNVGGGMHHGRISRFSRLDPLSDAVTVMVLQPRCVHALPKFLM